MQSVHWKSLYTRIVTAASSAPRAWSSVLIGGKSDGSSGPGVGSIFSVVQAGLVGGGVEMMIVGAVGMALGVVDETAGAQAVRRIIIRISGRNVFCIVISLLNGCL